VEGDISPDSTKLYYQNAIFFTLYRMKFLRSTALRLYFTETIFASSTVNQAARESSTVNQNFG
jgi:hypothetical protein